MGKKSPAPPPAPDYTTLAIKQGEANLAAAKQSAYMSNPNVYTPYGTQTVEWTKTPTVDTDAYNKAMEAWQANVYNNPYGYAGEAPTQEQFTTYIEQPTVRQTINPNAEAALREQELAQLYMSQAASGAASGLGSLGIASAFDARNIPGLRYDVAGAGDIQRGYPMMGYAGALGQGTGGEIAGAPQGIYSPMAGYYTEGLPGQVTAGQQAGAGPAAPTNLGQLDEARFFSQIAPGAFDFGAAQGGPSGVQFGGLDLSGIGAAQGAPNAAQFAAYGGVAAPTIRGIELGNVGPIYEGISPAVLGQAGAGPAGGLFGLAGGGPAGVQLGGLDTSGVQGIQGSVGQFGQAQGGTVAGPQLRGLDLSGIGGPMGGPQAGQFGYAQQFVQGPELQRQIDVSNIAQGPINAGTTAQQAILSRLSPQLQSERQQLQTQLINQGLRPGGEAYNAAMSAQMQKENDLLLQAAAQGISLDQAARQQQFAEQQSRAMFANQAALSGFGAGMEQAGLYNVGLGQNFQQALAAQQAQNQAQQQAFQQRLAGAEFGQEAELARFGAGMQTEEARNRAIAQNTQQALASGQFANEAQAQQFAQRLAAGEFGREAQLASFQTGQQAQQAINAAIAQNFAQGQAAQQMQNQAIQQNISNVLAAEEAQRAAQAQRFGQAVTGAQAAAGLTGQQFEMQQAAQQAQNQAQAQNFQQALAAAQQGNAAQQQNFLQRVAAGEFGREAQLATFQTGQQAAQAQNQALAQNFQQAIASQQAQNAAIAQNYQQALGAGQFNREALLQQFGMGQQAQQLANAAAGQNFQQQLAAQQANLARQAQQAGQSQEAAAFYNQAQAQAYQQELARQAAANAAQQQRFGQAMDIQAAQNAALAQNQAQQQAGAAFFNQAQQQQFQQNIAQQQFYNTAVQQALAQQAAIRSIPVNEISALLSGGQVNVPQFQGYSGVTVAPAPIFQAGQAAGDFAQRNYQNQVGAYNANMGLLGSIAGMAGTALGGPLGGAIGKGLFGG